MEKGTGKRKHGLEPHRLIIRVMALLLVAMFVVMLASEILVYAHATELSEIDQLKAQQSALQSQQAECQTRLDSLVQEKESAVEQYQLLAEQNQLLANEIDTNTTLLEEYNRQIEEVSQELTLAEDKHENYYELFCDRVSQMEQGGSISIWETIFSSRTITELLTSVYDMKSIIQYDNDVLGQMEQLETDIANKEEELRTAKEEQEALLDDLNEQKQRLEENEASAAAVLAEIQSNVELYTQQLAAITVECSDLEADILEKETAEAARLAAESVVRVTPVPDEEEIPVEEQEEEEPTEEVVVPVEEPEELPNAEETEEKEEPVEEPIEEPSEAEEEQPKEEPAAEETKEPEKIVTTAPSVTGDDVVAYAVQFIGNPYVWGGVSLTEGCDCSGFVMSVYAYFGYSLPHFSGSLRYSGIGVEYAKALPGDIICYDGHVGIYMGDGQMVNAFDSKHGIIICSVNTERLIAVRRIIY